MRLSPKASMAQRAEKPAKKKAYFPYLKLTRPVLLL